jgi:hypothetical protein
MDSTIIYQFYIYAYLRQDGTPYYIGKGCGRRAWKSSAHYIKPKKDGSNVIIMEDNLSEVGALALERFYIRWYGRKDLGTGILRNKSDGGDGPGTGRVPWNKGKVGVQSPWNKGKNVGVAPHWLKKHYIVTDPQGNTQEIIGLRSFCRDNNLKFQTINLLARGLKPKPYKGWTCQEV